MKLFLIRLTKSLFIRLRLHFLFLPIESFFLNLVYLSRLSEWASKNKKVEYNDFWSKWDYSKRYPLYNWVMEKEKLQNPINYLEFGVAAGESFNYFMEKNKHPESRFYGFDTFDGLPEDWGPFKKGSFSNNNNIPSLTDDRGRYFKGLFQQTLPAFINEIDNNRQNVVMLDADLWSASLFVLTSLAPILKKGDIIFFDEFVVPTHEFKAFIDFTKSYYVNLELIAAANNYYFVAFKVVE